MNKYLLAYGGDALDGVLVMALVVISIAIGVCAVVASCARLAILWRYHKYNRVQTSIGLTGAEATKKLLAFKGIDDVEVKKAGIFRAMIWGNSYAPNKKTIYLRRGIIDKASVTAVALACQKVGLAEQHNMRDKKYMAYSKLVPYCPFIGVFFIPMVIVGFILDIIIFNSNGIVPLIIAIVGVILYICAFVLVILNVPVEKKATVIALNIMKESGSFTAEELSVTQKLYKSYIVQYVTDMIMAILQLIKFILKVVLSARNSKR